MTGSQSFPPKPSSSYTSTAAQHLESDSSLPKYAMSALNNSGIYITAVVNHKKSLVLLDTGSTVSVISHDFLKKKNENCKKLSPIDDILTSANCSNIFLIGQTVVQMRIGGNVLDVPMVVAKDILHDCLLGSDFFMLISAGSSMTWVQLL